jgi:hypothetical protein
VLADLDGEVVVVDEKEASQTRDYCVARNATLGAARPDPSRRKKRLLRMTNGARFVPCRLLSSAEFDFIFVERANENVVAKGRGVNSVFLVQLRKMLTADFRGSTRIEDLIEYSSRSRLRGGCSASD